jgi:hypothetical protein
MLMIWASSNISFSLQPVNQSQPHNPNPALKTTTRDYNPVLRELGGEGALRGPASVDGHPLRGHFNRFELSRAEFADWAAQVGEAVGYEVAVFGFGRAAGDAATKAAASAAAAAAGDGGPLPPAVEEEAPDVEKTGWAAGAAAQGQLAVATASAAELVRRALAWGDAVADAAAAGAGAGHEPLAGVGHAMHAAVWVRKGGAAAGAQQGGAAAAASGGAPLGAAEGQAPLRCYWGPHVVEAQLPRDRAIVDGGGEAVAKPEAMGQI